LLLDHGPQLQLLQMFELRFDFRVQLMGRREENMANSRHVLPNPGGGWDVVKPKSDRASAHLDRQSEAMQRAREILGNAGGGELVIHGSDGRIRDADTIPPGNDPMPPRDKR
jgi:hypothetical protein